MQKIFFLCVTIVFTGSFAIPSFSAWAQERSERIVRVERGSRFERDNQTIIVKFQGENRERRIRISVDDDVEGAIEKYKNRKDVVYAEPNYIARVASVPNDPYYSYQWHIKQIGAEQAWDISKGSGAIVAVIDTGIARVSDLQNTVFVQGYDFANNDSNPTDDNGHGTHVAGTIAQSTNNSAGAAGIAHEASLMAIKALKRDGSGTYADIADSIRYAADNGAHVINMSLGGPVSTTYLEEAVAYAYNKGVTIVAAAGNDGQNNVSYPAAYNMYVIAVGATRYDKQKASYSNYGSKLDIVAPGGDTSVDQNGDGYGDGILQQTFSRSPNNPGYYFYQGTSMATPHVSGVAALLVAHGNAQNPSEIRSALESTAQDLGSIGWDPMFGNGFLNASAALEWTSDSAISPPDPPLSTPPSSLNPEVVFAESFEQGWGAWTQDSQKDWRLQSQRARNGSISAEVDGRAADAQLISPIIDSKGMPNTVIEFSWYIEPSVDKNEYIAFDVQTDEGVWQEYSRLRGDEDEEGIWHQVRVELQHTGNTRMRFRGTMSVSSEDANIDDITVTAW